MTQKDILTVTLNPAVDVSTNVAQVVAGPKLRCGLPRFDPGGGGVNVARTICKLGGQTRALVAVGGSMGDRLLDLLAAEDVATQPVPVSGETRQSFAVTDESTGAQYRFSVPGQELTGQDADTLIAAITDHTREDGFVIVSGSVAPGLPEDFLEQIITATQHKTPKVIIDTSGTALDRLITHPAVPLYLLRIDENEASEAAHRPLDTIADSVGYAADLVVRGVAEIVIIGRGAEGSVLVGQEHRLICHPPNVPVNSKIGAGDAFVGSMTLAMARCEDLPQALRWGVAAASATVSTEGTALCDAQTTHARFDQSEVEDL